MSSISVSHAALASFVLSALASSAFSNQPAVVSPDVIHPGDAVVRPFEPFVEQPGVLEFSGRLIVRPVQREDWVARGVPDALAFQLIGRAVERIADRLVRHYPEVDEFLIELGAGETENGVAAALMATGDYQYVVPDWICFPTVIPNDPFYPNQWHHPVIQSPLAWNITTGSATIICAFIDTGIDVNHLDLAAHRVPGYNSVTRIAEVDGGDVTDINGHGTAVAGTAAAIGNNNRGVAGVGWNQRIMMVRTSNASDGSASQTAILDGARWAAENGAAVVSASYSGVSSPSVETTGAYIRSLGSMFCYAAGNDNALLGHFNHENVIVVGATSQSDAKASFSAYGPAVDVFAPGVNIWTTRRGGGYGGSSGTSFSTPMVNGVISMIWSANPDLNTEQVELILTRSSDDLGEPGHDEVFGWGRVNVLRAVQMAMEAAGPVAPVADPVEVWAINDAPREVDVLANDYDLNLDPLTIIAYSPTSSAGGTVTLVTGAGPGGRDVLVYEAPAGYMGMDSFDYTISDPGGLTDSASVEVEVWDPSQFHLPDTPTSVSYQFHAAFYELDNPVQLPDFNELTPYHTKLLTWLNYAPTSGNWYGSGRPDNVGAVYKGFIYVPETDVYELFTESDDGSAMYVNGVKVVDNDGLHGMQERSGRIGLHAGHHHFRVEFFERTGEAGLIVRIRGGPFWKQPISYFNYFRDRCPADVNRDGVVGLADLAIVLENFGVEPAVYQDGDIDTDGRVTLSDLALLLENFGTACP